MKRCSKCHEDKELTEFYRKRGQKDGFATLCRSCEHKRAHQYRTQYRDRDLARKKRYRETHRRQIADRWKLYCQAHPEYRKRHSRRHESKLNAAYVYMRDRGLCHICHTLVKPEEVSLDHLVPFSDGGPMTYENSKLAHQTCNFSRGSDRYHRYRVQLQLLP
jgi:5-methylcytosine-specific restriction endonuclease McrA